MPKPLSHEQIESLQASGVVVPGIETLSSDSPSTVPAGLLLRTLGRVGLPHSEVVGRIDTDSNDLSARNETLASSLYLQESYLASYNSVSKIIGLTGETMPIAGDTELLDQLARLKSTFELFTSLGLQPEISLSPVNRPLSFWVDLAKAVEDSPLNPDEPDPEHQGQTRKVLRNGGLWVADPVKDEWGTLTNPAQPSWRVEVISNLDKPSIVNVTGYGYTDNKNQVPSPELNQLLESLSKLKVSNRRGVGSSKLLILPDIHPSIENYTMHQLSRIIQKEKPLDSKTWSWLNGTLASGDVSAGCWASNFGQVYLNWSSSGVRGGRFGVRPSGRG